MAEITKVEHILKIVGEDVVDEVGSYYYLNRRGMKRALFSDECPINLKGNVDFIICFVYNGRQPGDFGGAVHTYEPRPFRGLAHLCFDLNNFTIERLGNLLGGGIGHELGHYWLVPGATKIKKGIHMYNTPTEAEIAENLNQGLDYPPYPIIGRRNVHWSPFIDCNGTPMEGPNLGIPIKTEGIGFLNRFGRYDQIEGKHKDRYILEVPDLGDIEVHTRYCTLERYIIGSYKLPPIRRLFALGPRFRIFVPKWTFNLEFQAGLYVRLHSGATYYIGFYKGPNQICVHNIAESNPVEIIQLGDNPFDPHIKVGARLVQQNSKLFLQLRLWRPKPIIAISFSGKFLKIGRTHVILSDENIMTDLSTVGNDNTDVWGGWRTILSVEDRVSRMGVSSRTLANGHSIHTLLSARLFLNQDGINTPITLGELDHEIPSEGPELLPSGQLMMPYMINGSDIVSFQENSTTHDAPKLTMNTPEGDFAFGGLISLDRCVQVTWAGGVSPGTIMVGKAESVSLSRFVLLWNPEIRVIKQSEPLNDAYNVLFCAVSHNDKNITENMMINLDKIRKAWECFSYELMGRYSNTQFMNEL